MHRRIHRGLKTKWGILICLSLLAGAAQAATTWHVDDNAPNDPGPNDSSTSDPLENGSVAHPFDRIQEAINAAVNGDTVLVEPGTYLENLDFTGKNIRVLSSGGAETTTIDAQFGGSVVIFRNGETAGAVLSGFTLTHGSGTVIGSVDVGGAISCFQSAPVISNNIITGNTAHYGGAIDCEESNPLITNNLITQNVAADNHLAHLTGNGGAISIFNSSATITRNTIWNNIARLDGGALWINGYGDGTFNVSINCVNNWIVGHSADRRGGAVFFTDRGTLTVKGCTISGNTAQVAGHGLYVVSAACVTTLRNTILYGDGTAGSGSEIYMSGGTMTVNYSDVAGGQANAFVQSPAVLNWGTGNVNVNPLFTNAALGDYHLLPCSSLVNAGDPNYVPDAGETDIDGGSRISGPRIDMGADELTYVDCNGNNKSDSCDISNGTSADTNNNGIPDECEQHTGDLNCDGALDFFDIDAFILAVTDPVAYQAAYPNCNVNNADVNGDGEVDFFDIDPFIALLIG